MEPASIHRPLSQELYPCLQCRVLGWDLSPPTVKQKLLQDPGTLPRTFPFLPKVFKECFLHPETLKLHQHPHMSLSVFNSQAQVLFLGQLPHESAGINTWIHFPN